MKKIIKEIFGKNVTYSVDTNNEARTNDSAYNAKRQGDMIIIRSNSIKIEKFDKKTPINSLRKNILENIRNIKEEHLQYIKCESEECQTFLKCDIHPLVQAVHTAYAYHLPLVLTPDMIWYCIASSIAVYIKDNSELLRDKFVDFDGKKSIDIRRDDFVFGSLDNCWHETVDEFSNQINENTKGGIAEKLIANFSTTTIVSKVSSQIVLMDAMQNYFEYTVMTMCCVPEIRLCGDKNDWISVKTKTNEIAQILPALNEWIKNLNEILQNFIDVYDDGEVRTDFWNRIYKRETNHLFINKTKKINILLISMFKRKWWFWWPICKWMDYRFISFSIRY